MTNESATRIADFADRHGIFATISHTRNPRGSIFSVTLSLPDDPNPTTFRKSLEAWKFLAPYIPKAKDVSHQPPLPDPTREGLLSHPLLHPDPDPYHSIDYMTPEDQDTHIVGDTTDDPDIRTL